jgi:hypothetical protein
VTRALDALSLLLAAAGVLVMASWKKGVPVTMELWTAAGLLRLCGEPSWSRIATAASIIAVRHLVIWRRRAA